MERLNTTRSSISNTARSSISNLEHALGGGSTAERRPIEIAIEFSPAPGRKRRSQDQSTRQTYVRQQTNRDVGQIVSKWHIKFSGSSKEQSVELFLTRIEECRALANLIYDQVLSSLSELLTGEAATWYRNNRHTWRSWQKTLPRP